MPESPNPNPNPQAPLRVCGYGFYGPLGSQERASNPNPQKHPVRVTDSALQRENPANPNPHSLKRAPDGYGFTSPGPSRFHPKRAPDREPT